ncbi:elongation factor G [Actinokineospora iranica]|uniref:Ribosomal protection tetracycline resistance protein n=1 Tax=Actinokineospora iranica TaxID=1271860 RepID=A0A1G6S0R7_9PSEU|nr:TetM/TetW/TetO/TetS family tetracycline resistance ribosomal protection protein [Actinokineospora iranica]SDD10449.1 ribosomal protection tetracycline resistance protein [Actinokineospora iranica]
MRTVNLGIVAHVDAGKTSLTERLLYAAGVIDAVGSVDEGSTRTDTLELERRRGITIKSAVVSFVVDGVTVNLIDTPGHPDFIAEVERVLTVLDGAVLVVSAVEGVQARTRVLMRTLRRLRIPTLVFVNKIDRRGARCDAAEKLGATVPMGSVSGLGTRGARYLPFGAGELPADALAENSDAFLAAYLDGEVGGVRDELRAQTGRAVAHPVFFGSAITGAGVAELISGVTGLLPAKESDADGPVTGTVFKVERGPAGEKIAYARLFSGTVRTRERLRVGDKIAKVTGISVFERGSAVRRDSVEAGRIGKLWGLDDVRVGDPIGVPETAQDNAFFAPPTLETVVVPCHEPDRGALHVALTRLAEQDPLINLRYDGARREFSVSLYGEVQKEVIQATLADEFGVEAAFHETTTVHIERLVGSGAAVEFIGKEPNPFLATVGLRVDPAPAGAGVEFRLGVELGSMPFAFFTAVAETVRETLGQGPHGWEIPDCVVTMTHSGYAARQSHSGATFDKSMSSTAGDFRDLTPLVLMTALRQAGTVVHEPLHRFHLDIPADTLGAVLPVVARLRGVPRDQTPRGSSYLVAGVLPAAKVHELESLLPGLTRGEAVLECAFDHYQPIQGPIPTRARSDNNPLDRKEYLMRTLRRV